MGGSKRADERRLEQIADEILGLRSDRLSRAAVRTQRSYYTEEELSERCMQEVPCGDHLIRYGYSDDGEMLVGDAADSFSDE